MASLDVGEAFLKGLTFDKVQQLNGGRKREVCMLLPRATSTQPSGTAILRQIPGFENFSEASDALEMLKGGFGLADAPNLFTSRVDQVFRDAGLERRFPELLQARVEALESLLVRATMSGVALVLGREQIEHNDQEERLARGGARLGPRGRA